MESYELERLAEIEAAVHVLEESLDRFVARLGPPLFIPEKDKPRFRYPEPTSAHFQVLRCVRIVSALNALMALLRQGFTSEMGVLIRTVSEFIEDIMFVHEAHMNDPVPQDQIDFLNQFFAEDIRSPAELMSAPKGPKRVRRGAVRAAQARILHPKNPKLVEKISWGLDDTYSRYVHGAYPTIMELYDDSKRGFRVRGKLGSPKIRVFRHALAAAAVHPALNTFSVVAATLGLNDVREFVIKTRKIFEETLAYRD